ncbi:hypothetical protein [Streptomyces subrutilus]|uniref:hypothetical protein n=1 Tax=Streptomyces subrutilus TaxID=36818 RepID=UPI002E106B40|nr:hypothetical protein OG479_32740 [Streptomyces subrutilus]
MRKSRRHQREQQINDYSQLLAENGQLLRSLRDLTSHNAELTTLVATLSTRPAPVAVRPAGGGYVPAAALAASESARALLADRLELLQNANMSLVCTTCAHSLTAVAA